MLTCVLALGLVSIVGSGGISGCGFAYCPDAFYNIPPLPTVEPTRSIVQVGGTATFSVRAPGITNPTYQWSRRSMNGPSTDIPGATGATYTLAGANLSDDGATFSATVRGGFNGEPVVVESWSSWPLIVSSMPAVVFQDSEFQATNWSIAEISEPTTGGPTHVEEQVLNGGNPGAYRRTTITMSAGPSRLHVFDTFASAVYDPASQGPLYIVEFTQDCIALSETLGVGPTLLLEQNGRRYIASELTPCEPGTWSNMTLNPAHLSVWNFYRVDGPTCNASEACPDFSAGGKPIRFGFANSNQALAAYAGGSGGFGIDNWKVSAWRR